MTKKEKETMMRLLLDGKDVKYIAKALHMTTQQINKAMDSQDNFTVRRARKRPYTACIYPNIDEWLTKSGISYHGLSDLILVSESTISNNLSGKSDMGKYVIDSILRLSGMTYEEAFQTKEDT